MLNVAFKDLKTRKSRTAMVSLGVMTCVLLIGVIGYITYNLEGGIQANANTIAGKLVFEKYGTGYPPSGSIIPENVSNQVLANNVVNPNKSTAILATALPLNSTTTAGIVGVTPGKERTLINNIKVNGQDSLLGQSNNSVILGSQAAINYNVTVGDTLTVDNQKLKVIGVMQKQSIATATSLDSTVFAALPFVQNISQSQGIVTADIITPNNGVSLQDAQNTLQNSFNSSLYTIYNQQDALQLLNANENASYVFLDLIIAMILIVSAILIMVVMMMSVKERTKDIGTMRALGTSRMKIMLLILYESLIISCIGGIIGIILIIPIYDFFLYLAGSTSYGYTIPLSILLEVIFVILVIGTFSGLIPAYQATRISPIEALRYE